MICVADMKYGDVLIYPHSGARVMFLRSRSDTDHKDITWWCVLLDQATRLGRNLNRGDLCYFTLPISSWERVK